MNWENYRSTQKGELLQFEKASPGAHCSSEINLAKLCGKEHFPIFSIRNNTFNNWISTSSLVSLVSQRDGTWDSRVSWMNPWCPAPIYVDSRHFTHQQKLISPSNTIFYVMTEFFHPGCLATWRTQASYSNPEFLSLSPHYYLLPCRACCPRNLMSVHFSDTDSLHGDHLVCPLLCYLFLKGHQNSREKAEQDLIPCEMMKQDSSPLS